MRSEIVAFNEVSAKYTAIEGEGDGSLEYWRKGHWNFFSRECRRIGREPTETMPVICNVFEVLHVLPVPSEASHLAQAERQRQTTWPGQAVRRTLSPAQPSPAQPWRPAVVTRLARKLGITLEPPRTSKIMIAVSFNTASLRLRHIVVEEAVRMMKLNGEPSTRRWLPSHVYANAQEATERMRYLISCYVSPGHPRLGPYVLAVDQLVSGELLGHVGFSPFNEDVEVSYAIAEAYRGCGYGTEALYFACQWAASSFGLSRLLAITESENEPSRRTLVAARFVHSEDSVMRFQGTEQAVSHYVWHPSAGKAQ